MTDYAIARRIVDLHSRMEESVEREYTTVSRRFKHDFSLEQLGLILNIIVHNFIIHMVRIKKYAMWHNILLEESWLVEWQHEPQKCWTTENIFNV